MSNPNDTSGAGLEGILQFGQSLAQNFFQFVNQQGAVPGKVPTMPESVTLPGAERMLELQRDLAARHAALWSGLMQSKPGETPQPVVAPPPGDRRFSAPEWNESPVFDYLRQAYLINAEFLGRVSDSLPIEDGRAKERIQFLTRQYVDAMAPSNFAATNPEFLKTAVETKGESITRGIQNLLKDLEKGRISMTDDSAFDVGRNLAVTPGSVIYE
ncbi:MAG: class I poly(R)-hydroxyalkanoic acid synthase, partial [Rhodocyclaceae bacterium]|nr:class I poly(R)-hydroxyalkanoic acid synthase [Rhodocyclaceae bacterium]